MVFTQAHAAHLPPFWHGSGTHTVNSIQFTRSARLILAYPINGRPNGRGIENGFAFAFTPFPLLIANFSERPAAVKVLSAVGGTIVRPPEHFGLEQAEDLPKGLLRRVYAEVEVTD